MNGKKAKLARKASKVIAESYDLPETRYQEYDIPVFTQINYNWFKTRKGTPLKLHPRCRRSIYQKMKNSLGRNPQAAADLAEF